MTVTNHEGIVTRRKVDDPCDADLSFKKFISVSFPRMEVSNAYTLADVVPTVVRGAASA